MTARKNISVKRYAQVIFEIAKEGNKLEEWKEALGKISEIMQNNELTTILDNPKVPLKSKRELLEKCMGLSAIRMEEKTFAEMQNLATLLVTKNAIRNASLIESEYNVLLDIHTGIKRAKITTAISLEEQDKQNIISNLENLTNKKVSADFEINPNIVGGAIIKIGDRLIDGSIKNKLINLKNSLSGDPCGEGVEYANQRRRHSSNN